MSELPSSALDYGAVVAEYFLALRGVGLLLSPLDEELVAEWERRGIPVAVVCRGIRAWVASLPPGERAALGRRIRLLAGPRDARASLRSHRDALRSHVSDAARTAGLTRLRGSV